MMTKHDHDELRLRIIGIADRVGIGCKFLADLLPATRMTINRIINHGGEIVTERRFNAVKRAVDDLYAADAQFGSFEAAAKLGYYSRAKFLKQEVQRLHNPVQAPADPV